MTPNLRPDSVKKKIIFKKMEGGIKITGKKTDDVGKLAFDAKVPVLELASQGTSLEDAFLELTSGSEEFVAKSGDKK